MSSRDCRLRLGVALAIYIAAAVLWMLPLLVHFGSAVLNGPNDSVTALADYWAVAQAGETPFTADHNPYIGAPEGYPRTTSVVVANALQPLAFLGLEPLLGYVGAWNVLTVSGFVLSALGAFALLLYLRFRFATALLGGYVFGFGPWMFARALEGHAGMQHLWILPLLFLSFLRLRRIRTPAAAIVLGMLLTIAFYLHSYIGLMASVMVASFYALELILSPARVRTLLLGIVSLVTALVLFSPPLWLYLTDRGGVAQSLAQPFSDLQAGGATLLDYVLPSQGHPFLGWMRPDRLAREHVLFFGYTTMIGAAFGLALALRKRDGAWETERRYAARLAGVIGAVALLASFKPLLDVGVLQLKTPSYLIAEHITFWRAYARLGIVVGLCLIVLAAFAFEWLLDRRRGRLLGAAAAAILIVELAAGPPIPTWRTDSELPHVTWLRNHPGGIVASYPLPIEEAALELGQAETWNVVRHGHPLFGLMAGNTGGTREEAIRIVASNLAEPVAAGVLAAERVRYVVVHDDVYRSAGASPPRLDSSLYRPAARLGDTRIFRVAAEPLNLERTLVEQSARIALARATPRAEAELGSGFNAPETFEDGREWRWMIQAGRIEVSSATAGRYLLVVDAFANSEPRRLTLRAEDGAELASTTVQTSRQTHVLGPFDLSAPATLVLGAEPGPQPLGADRRASVFLSPIELRPAPDFLGRLND